MEAGQRHRADWREQLRKLAPKILIFLHESDRRDTWRHGRTPTAPLAVSTVRTRRQGCAHSI